MSASARRTELSGCGGNNHGEHRGRGDFSVKRTQIDALCGERAPDSLCDSKEGEGAAPPLHQKPLRQHHQVPAGGAGSAQEVLRRAEAQPEDLLAFDGF